MLRELSLLLQAAPIEAPRAACARLVIDENCLGKRTAATRKSSLQRLRELYGLDRRLLSQSTQFPEVQSLLSDRLGVRAACLEL